MNFKDQKDWFSDIETIVKEPLKFKVKLNIGEDAYKSLRIKKLAYELWDVAGVAGTAATVAKSATVASMFFAPTGWLAAIGIGTAVTPLGWVIAAGVVTGGAWMGITRYVKSVTNDRVMVIPQFINTPLDVLALGLFDLLGPLAMKVAAIDESIHDSERQYIHNYFIDEWGYDKQFVENGLNFCEAHLKEYSIKQVANTLAEFQKINPDCNFKLMSKDLMYFLSCLIEADGKIDEREEMAIEKIENILKEKNNFFSKFKLDSNKKFNILKSISMCD